MASASGAGLGSRYTAPSTAAPVVINENWVCCHECQKWRLLPFGKNPCDLPEEWVCCMLDWLHGMNRCSVSEEETTKALYDMSHLLPPSAQESAPLTPVLTGAEAAEDDTTSSAWITSASSVGAKTSPGSSL